MCISKLAVRNRRYCMTIQEMELELQQHMDNKRFHHTLGVMYTAGSLAMAHGVNVYDAMVGGLLHDCAKCVPKDVMKQKCIDHGVELSSFESENMALIHAKLGVAYASKYYGIVNPDILDSISYHTTGRPDMAVLEKIVYIADCIEPHRTLPNLDKLREFAFTDLDKAVYECSKHSLEHLQNRNIPIDPMTNETYEFYKPKEDK